MSVTFREAAAMCYPAGRQHDQLGGYGRAGGQLDRQRIGSARLLDAFHLGAGEDLDAVLLAPAPHRLFGK